MPRHIPRNPVLRTLDTTEVVNWLKIARRRGYTGAIIDLEIELSTRKLLHGAVREPAVHISHIADPARRAKSARKRLQRASSRQAVDVFHENLWNLDPANFAQAWILARNFVHLADRAEALVHVAHSITTYFKGQEEANTFISGKTADKCPQGVIDALEDHFGRLIDQSAEAQNA